MLLDVVFNESMPLDDVFNSSVPLDVVFNVLVSSSHFMSQRPLKSLILLLQGSNLTFFYKCQMLTYEVGPGAKRVK